MCVCMMTKVSEYAFKEDTANGDGHVVWWFQMDDRPWNFLMREMLC